MKRDRGRPTKLDDEVAEKIVNALRSGAYRKVAAVWAGISARTLREWMVEGKEKPSSAYGVFRRKVLAAETAAEIQVGSTAFMAAANDPAYALAYMRVRWRKRWSPAEKVELTGKGGAALIPPVDPMSLLDKLRKMELAGPVGVPSKGE